MILGIGARSEHYLSPDERRVFRARPKWVAMVKPIAIAIGLLVPLKSVMLVVGLAGPPLWLITTILWYVQVAVLVWLLYEMLWWWYDILMVTDKRLMRVTGVFDTKLDEMSIDKITDRTVYQSFLGYLLNYGYTRIESAGQRQSLEHINYIADPWPFYEAVTKTVVGKSALPPPRRGRKRFGGWPETPDVDEQSKEWPESGGSQTESNDDANSN
jgi:hypothetical protein